VILAGHREPSKRRADAGRKPGRDEFLSERRDGSRPGRPGWSLTQTDRHRSGPARHSNNGHSNNGRA